MGQAYLGSTELNQTWLGNTEIYEVGLRNQQFTTSNLYAYYDFNNPVCYPGSGSTIFDLSGNGNDLTISGSVTYTTDGNIDYFTWTTSSLGRLFRPAASSSVFTGTGVTVTDGGHGHTNRVGIGAAGVTNSSDVLVRSNGGTQDGAFAATNATTTGITATGNNTASAATAHINVQPSLPLTYIIKY